ncbi:MAG: SUF system NifU family Fe-S cluster assembly protein [Acidimicrobiales bacterium]|nr:SUF system NifU family Fe-S cluster assembly protein [Acidimicrobiaceae bacterium]MDP6162521.1 SUF system NifU family Fe-S cluster assembly protein [Acidimicrobiales bacterium]MDP6286051.1 SUF system NifU family Fe-S cluster assembly protein [Acidimicrobiales bacterium]HJL91463.1 SUF system NifU family Fe-S cluster assembly protein [Acidimicrobiales bacterium]HJO41173.1 SUF system NifU family Fe-S cluster assembly protein [Acidimicrobiales bacterium]
MPGLEDLYKEIILDHYKNPRNQGELSVPPAIMEEGFNPLCGDEVKVYVLTDGDLIKDIRIDGQGCSISQASASMMAESVIDKTLEEAKNLIERFKEMMSVHESNMDSEELSEDNDENSLGDLQALKGVVKYPVRIKCATLGWNTFDQIITPGE